jgi:hypothetical protein
MVKVAGNEGNTIHLFLSVATDTTLQYPPVLIDLLLNLIQH